MRIPALENPADYVGSFLYDFGDRVSAGYTAEEIRFLQESESFKTGTPYQIYRVDESGRMEIRGVAPDTLFTPDGLIFYYLEAGPARSDFSYLTKSAQGKPLTIPVELSLARIAHSELAEALVLAYPHHATQAASSWLLQVKFYAGNESTAGGSNAISDFFEASPDIHERLALPVSKRFLSRTAKEVLAAVALSVQR